MIAEFTATWGLFHNAYVSGLLIAATLSIIGIAVVARDQVFIGAAVSQGSMLGIAAGILATESLSPLIVSRDPDVIHSLFGGAAAVLAALITAAPTLHRETREAVTGWIFLFASSGSVLLLANSPHGLAEVNRLLVSTLIGARPGEVYALSLLFAVVLGTVIFRRDEIILLITAPETAAAVGLRTKSWERGLAIGLGVAVAFAMHVSGMLFTFGLLVLPTLIAKTLCAEIRQIFVVAPAVAITAALASFVIANTADLPPAQVAVASLCLILALAWTTRGLGR